MKQSKKNTVITTRGISFDPYSLAVSTSVSTVVFASRYRRIIVLIHFDILVLDITLISQYSVLHLTENVQGESAEVVRSLFALA